MYPLKGVSAIVWRTLHNLHIWTQHLFYNIYFKHKKSAVMRSTFSYFFMFFNIAKIAFQNWKQRNWIGLPITLTGYFPPSWFSYRSLPDFYLSHSLHPHKTAHIVVWVVQRIAAVAENFFENTAHTCYHICTTNLPMCINASFTWFWMNGYSAGPHAQKHIMLHEWIHLYLGV